MAQTIGSLSLSLRSIADNQAELDRAIAAGDIKVPDNATPEEEEMLLQGGMARPSDQGSTFVTGSDVSRFQRTDRPYREGSADHGERRCLCPHKRTTPADGPAVRVTRGKSNRRSSCGEKLR